MRPSALRSSQVAHAKPSSTRLTTTNALMTWIHQGSFSASGTRLLHLDAILEAVRVVVRDADDARAQPAVEPGPQIAGGAVRGNAHGLAGRDSPRLRIVERELHLGRRALEGELRHALDRRAAEERPEADELQARAGGLAGRDLRIGLRPGELVRRRELGEVGGGRGGPGVDLDAQAPAEAREPLELVRPGRGDRAPQALRPALEVDEGAVALEVARARDDHVRPRGELALEHRGREDEAGPLGELPHARVVGGLVAGGDERADLSLRGRVGAPLAALVPGGRDAASVRHAGQDVDGDVGFPALAELVRERADVAAAGRVVLRPDEGDLRRSAERLRGRAQLAGHALAALAERGAGPGGRRGSERDAPARAQRD